MKIIKPGHIILTHIDGDEILRDLELIARTCYKSEDRICDGSARKLITSLIKNGHEAMIEHGIISVRIICSRSTSHELVRQRIASFAMESQRYCNYGKDGEVAFIEPFFFIEDYDAYYEWMNLVKESEKTYLKLLKLGKTPQQARTVLPESTKTEIVITTNYREWRHILKLRCAEDADPQMREIMIPLLHEFQNKIPILFDDIIY